MESGIDVDHKFLNKEVLKFRGKFFQDLLVNDLGWNCGGLHSMNQNFRHTVSVPPKSSLKNLKKVCFKLIKNFIIKFDQFCGKVWKNCPGF